MALLAVFDANSDLHLSPIDARSPGSFNSGGLFALFQEHQDPVKGTTNFRSKMHPKELN
jgi:hypothetical protein